MTQNYRITVCIFLVLHDADGSHGDGEKSVDSEYILKKEPTG